LYICFFDVRVGVLSFPDTVQHFELFSREDDVFLVKFVLDGPPPLRVLLFLDELVDLVVWELERYLILAW
jgi:hypothetical protein